MELEQIAAIQRVADLIEAEHRGLTWEKVGLIRRSKRSAAALARELGVSDTLVRKVRRGQIWNGAAATPNRNDSTPHRGGHAHPRGPARVRALRGRHPARRRCRRPHSHPWSATETDAGERAVRTVPALRERLADHRMDYPAGPSQPAFPSRNGTRQHPDDVRARILAPILDRANGLLEAEGRPPIAHMTPHTLRRTFASILAVCDVPPRRATYLLGHTDPKLTLAVYQQSLDLGKGSVEVLERVLACTFAEARAIFNGESPPARVSGTNPEPGTKKASVAGDSHAQEA